MTYTETRGKKPIDWNARLNKKKINNRQWRKWGNDSGEWVTCACGNQCSIIPRFYEGSPKDKDLRRLGIRFFEAIVWKDINSAKKILQQIENRSAELIFKINNVEI